MPEPREYWEGSRLTRYGLDTWANCVKGEHIARTGIAAALTENRDADELVEPARATAACLSRISCSSSSTDWHMGSSYLSRGLLTRGPEREANTNPINPDWDAGPEIHLGRLRLVEVDRLFETGSRLLLWMPF